MNFSGWGLFAGTVFGTIGVGYLMYGRRQMRIVHVACGMILMVFPWFVSNLGVLLGLGFVLVLAPFAASWWFGI